MTSDPTPETAALPPEVLDYLVNSRNALRAAAVIGQRSCRDGDHLNYANHDRLVAEADRLLDRDYRPDSTGGQSDA